MTLFTSVIELFSLIRFDLIASLSWLAASTIYGLFSHGVHSASMDLCFLPPLLNGIFLLLWFLLVPAAGVRKQSLRHFSGILLKKLTRTGVLSFLSRSPRSAGHGTMTRQAVCGQPVFGKHVFGKSVFRHFFSGYIFLNTHTILDFFRLCFLSRISASFFSVGMFLTGIMEIAGTRSGLPQFLFYIGLILFFFAVYG